MADVRTWHNDQLSQPCSVLVPTNTTPLVSMTTDPPRPYIMYLLDIPWGPGLWPVTHLCLWDLQLNKINPYFLCCNTCMYLINLDMCRQMDLFALVTIRVCWGYFKPPFAEFPSSWNIGFIWEIFGKNACWNKSRYICLHFLNLSRPQIENEVSNKCCAWSSG